MNNSKLSDKDLIAGLKHDNEESFNLIYTLYCGKVYNFIMRSSDYNSTIAEEVTQITFIKLWENRHAMSVEGSLNALIYTIAKNTFINLIKRKIRELIYQRKFEDCTEPFVNNLEEQLHYSWLENKIREYIEELPPARKQIYTMSKLQNFSTKEIARILAISENTVEAQLRKATTHVRSRLAPFLTVLSVLTTSCIVNVG